MVFRRVPYLATAIVCSVSACVGDAEPLETTEATSPLLSGAWTKYFGGTITLDTVDTMNAPTGIVRIGGGLLENPHNPSATDLAKLALIKRTVSAGGEVVFNIAGFSAAPGPFIQRQKDNPALWDQDLRRQIEFIYGNEADRPQRMARIHFELFNEINSEGVSNKLCVYEKWAGDCELATHSDRRIIRPYIEYAAAPSIRVIKEINPAAKILTGSLFLAYDPKALDWYQALLNSFMPPGWGGRRFVDVVDFLNLHYPVTSSDTAGSEDDLPPFTVLDKVYAMRARPDQGVISTEELGIFAAGRGLGAPTTLRIVSTYLHYWSMRGIDPTLGKAILWGWWIGYAGADTNDGELAYLDLVRALGGTSVVRTIPGAFQVVGDPINAGNVRGHALCTGECTSAVGERRYVVIVFVRSDLKEGTLQDFELTLPTTTLATLRSLKITRAGYYPKRMETTPRRVNVGATMTVLGGATPRVRIHLAKPYNLGYDGSAPSGERRRNEALMLELSGS